MVTQAANQNRRILRPTWNFYVNYLTRHRYFRLETISLFTFCFSSSLHYLRLSINPLLLMRHPMGVMHGLREFTGDYTPFKWRWSHFYAHPRSSSLPNPCQDEECQQRARQTSDNVVLLPKDLEPLCHSLLSTKLNFRLPWRVSGSASVYCRLKNDVAPVVAGSEWGVGWVTQRPACGETGKKSASR